MKLKLCPFCHKDVVFVGVHDDEGNFHGLLGCDHGSAYHMLCITKDGENALCVLTMQMN